jgi:hypothetical protein
VRVHPLSAEEVAAEKCWYVAEGTVGQEVGPYTIEQMKEYITNGVITYDRKIRHKQNDELVEAYRYASQFPELVEQQQLQLHQLQQPEDPAPEPEPEQDTRMSAVSILGMCDDAAHMGGSLYSFATTDWKLPNPTTDWRQSGGKAVASFEGPLAAACVHGAYYTSGHDGGPCKPTWRCHHCLEYTAELDLQGLEKVMLHEKACGL